jgi:hypothetical protein
MGIDEPLVQHSDKRLKTVGRYLAVETDEAKRERYNGWTVSPNLSDYDEEKVYGAMKPGSFIKVYREGSYKITLTDAMPGTHGDYMVQVRSNDAAKVIEKGGFAQVLRGLTIPLVVVGDHMTGIGKISKDEEELTGNMLRQKRTLILSTYYSDEVKRYLEGVCKFPIGLHHAMFKDTMLRVAEEIDRFIFKTKPGSAQASEAKLAVMYDPENKGKTEEEAAEMAFKIHTTKTGEPKEKYRLPFWADPNHPGEWLLMVQYPVFAYAKKEKGKPPPRSWSVKQVQDEYARSGRVLPEGATKEDEAVDFAEFAAGLMLEQGSPYIPCAFATSSGDPLIYESEEGKSERDKYRSMLRQGCLVQISMGFNGVLHLQFHGSKLRGDLTQKITVLPVYFALDNQLQGEEYLSHVEGDYDHGTNVLKKTLDGTNQYIELLKGLSPDQAARLRKMLREDEETPGDEDKDGEEKSG